VFNQTVSLLVDFCCELGIFAWLACSAPIGLRYLAAFHFAGRCFAVIELFVVAFELLALACRSRSLARFRRETLRAALPAGIVRVGPP